MIKDPSGGPIKVREIDRVSSPRIILVSEDFTCFRQTRDFRLDIILFTERRPERPDALMSRKKGGMTKT